MSNSKFKKGDVVYLKSGSPPLVVTDIEDFDDGCDVNVSWAVSDGLETENFHEACLSKEKPVFE